MNPSTLEPMRHPEAFAETLIAWQRIAGRHDLPWQYSRDPYRIWLSEIMLQQTQVATVTGYYNRFVARFPDVRALAAAPLDEVMQLWSGLGYYSRARNLHRAARFIVDHCSARFPADREALMALPGVGRSTAAAIAAFAYGAREAILDGNVRRVLARHFAVAGDPRERAAESLLWSLAQSLLPERDITLYIQGLMDLGATVCVPRKPKCEDCPIARTCAAFQSRRVAEFPGARRRRPLPRRRATLLVLECAGDILLEKRPPTGIWGGLWCLPELPDDAELAPFVRARLGCTVQTARALPLLRHSFTHFSLDITPMHARVTARAETVQDASFGWHPLAGLSGIALPAPVKRILGGELRLSGGSSRAAS